MTSKFIIYILAIVVSAGAAFSIHYYIKTSDQAADPATKILPAPTTSTTTAPKNKAEHGEFKNRFQPSLPVQK